MSRTEKVLNKLSKNHRNFIKQIREEQKKVMTDDYSANVRYNFVMERRAMVRGYLRCLVDCGIISQSDFSTILTYITA